MDESAKRHEENSNIIKEIRASTDATIRNQGASIKTLEIQIGQISSLTRKGNQSPYTVSGSQQRSIFSEIVPFPRRLQNYCCDDWIEAQDVKIMEAYDHTLPQKEKYPWSLTLPCFIHNVCFDKALVDLGASVSVMPFFTYTNLGLGILSHTRLTIELADRTIKQPRGIAENVLVRIGKFIFPIYFIILDIPEDDDFPLILGRPFLSTAHSKIDVYKRKINLRVGEEKFVFKSIKPATSIIRRVFMLKDLDSKTKLIEEDNESFDPLYGNYIELNDLDTPLEPETNQDVNFEPTFVNEPDHFKTNSECFIIIDDEDVTRDVALGMPFFMKYAPFGGCDRLVSRAKVIENQIMAAPVISLSSDVSVESVGSSFPRVILIGSISVEVPVAPEVGADAVASPAGVLELDTRSSLEADPLESSPPPVSVAPMVLPFLCLDDLESDTEIPERHVSPTPHDAMLTRWRSRVASRSSSPTTSTLKIHTAPLHLLLPHPGFVDDKLFLSDPGRTFPLVDFTVLILVGHVGH
ncbi:ribonuclease H-like domain-containing protein [Tanacetum coccineum]